MSYQVLARKWRPRTFEDLVGQEHVLRVLINALSKNRLHHAYLFAGTRGVGKTTLARIFAKCLNCEVALGPTPCGTCATCRAIDAGQFLDLYEIDAASRTKVEDTRDLLENVAYPPVQGRYKVYLIDEVHMLSGHSFNALLKTLEEPPPQVMFIFATTEPKRLPITILSRCLQFHLKQIAPEQIVGQLKRICDSEAMSFEPEALAQLARAADGSLRDALSLLDQAIVYCEGALTYEQLNQMLGYITQDEVARLLQALSERDGQQLFSVLADLHRRAPDYQQVLAELIASLHQAAVFQIVPTQAANEMIKGLAGQFSAEEIQLYYQIALLGQKDLPFAPSPAQGFEMLMLRMLAFRPLEGLKAEPVVMPIRSERKEKKAAAATALVGVKEIKKENASPVSSVTSEWRELLPKLGLTGVAYALALNCTMENLTETHLGLLLAGKYKAMATPKLQERIEQALSRYFNRSLQLSIRITEEEVNSPALQQEQEQKVRHASALEALHQDPGVQKIKALFNATIDSQSLEVGE
jgi:DNA polymerase-3 subunit gamma/tau